MIVVNHPDQLKLAHKQTVLSSTRVAMTDLLSAYDTIPHRSASCSGALTVLWGGMHATVCTNEAAFSPAL